MNLPNITIEEFRKVEVKIGKVISCEKVENADKLLKLQVDFGEFQRQIVTAIAEYYSEDDLVGKSFPFVTNLEPRTFRGVESQGMLMAVDGENKPVFLIPQEEVKAGSVVV